VIRSTLARHLLTAVLGAVAAMLVLAGPAVAAPSEHAPASSAGTGVPAGPLTKPVSPAPSGAKGPKIVTKPKLPRRVLTPLTTWTVNLTASPNWLWPTQSSSLVATASQDVGPTPYYISIYDTSSGTYVAICGTGTTCTASVTQPTPATHYYVALVSLYPTSYAPPGE